MFEGPRRVSTRAIVGVLLLLLPTLLNPVPPTPSGQGDAVVLLASIKPSDPIRGGDRDDRRERGDRDDDSGGRCYQDLDYSRAGMNDDLLISARINTLNNATHHLSFDGTCSGSVTTVLSVVSAKTRFEAKLTCASIGAVSGDALNFVDYGYLKAPKSWWRCLG